MEITIAIAIAVPCVLLSLVTILTHRYYMNELAVKMAEVEMKKQAVAALKDKIEIRLSTEDLKSFLG